MGVSEEPTDSPRRWFNDDRKRLFGGDGQRLIAFVCECTDPDCREAVLLTADEYEARRGRLVVHENHPTTPAA